MQSAINAPLSSEDHLSITRDRDRANVRRASFLLNHLGSRMSN